MFGKDYHLGHFAVHFAVHFAEVMSYDVIIFFMSKEEKKSNNSINIIERSFHLQQDCIASSHKAFTNKRAGLFDYLPCLTVYNDFF